MYSGPANTLIWDLFHGIPLLSLIPVIPFIFNPFCFSGPDPFPVSLFFRLLNYIFLHALIVMVLITSKSFFFGPTHPFFFLTHTSPLQMATTHNQELQASINQAHFSIEHITSQMDSTHSLIEKLEHKFNNMEANLKTQFTSLQSIVNQLLNRPTGPSSLDQSNVVDSSQSLHFQSKSFHREPRLPCIEVNKFDGSNPTGWVTQMEHYFSLHGITNELAKLLYDVLYLDPECWQWWKWRKNSR
jgi:hypothetical protein